VRGLELTRRCVARRLLLEGHVAEASGGHRGGPVQRAAAPQPAAGAAQLPRPRQRHGPGLLPLPAGGQHRRAHSEQPR